MKLVLGDYSSRLEDIQRDDIWYKNLSARKRRPDQKFDSKPQIGIRLDKYPELVELFKENGVEITEYPDKNDNSIIHHCVELRAYPKMKAKRFGNGMEQLPKVIVRSTEETKRLKQRHFGTGFDVVALKNMIISFSWYEPENSKGVIPAINSVWADIDEDAGGFNDAFIDAKYGYSEENDSEEEYDGEETPFD